MRTAQSTGAVVDRWLRLHARGDLAKYSADQPRDDHGRFGSGGSSDEATSATPAGAARQRLAGRAQAAKLNQMARDFTAKHPGVTVDLAGSPKSLPMDPALAQRALDEADRIMTKYPETTAGLTHISYSDPSNPVEGHPPMSQTAYARVVKYWDKGQELQLNSNYWTSATRLNIRLTHDANIGWHPPGCTTPESVVAHEFGHVLQNGSNDYFFQGQVHDNVFSGVSKYGDTSPREGWAESVSAAMHGSAAIQDHPAVQEARKMLDRFK